MWEDGNHLPGEPWHATVPDSAWGYREMVSSAAGGSQASSCWEGLSPLPPWGQLLPASCHEQLRHGSDPGGGNLSQTTLLAG